MKNKLFLFTIGLALTALLSCDLERNLDIDLPDYQNILVVESYLEAGKPYRLLLTQSISYFEIPVLEPIDRNRPITLVSSDLEIETTIQDLLDLEVLDEDDIPALPPSIDEAQVIITRNGIPDTLENRLYVELDERAIERDSFDSVFFKFYNFYSPTLAEADYDNDYELIILDGQGRTALARTRFLPPVPIDSSVIRFSETDTLASYQIWFTDPANEKNYYRHTLNKKSLFRGPKQNFALDDRFFEGEAIVFATGYDFEEGDTLITSLYHIDEAYHDFLETFDEAEDANGNPFGQPATILTNIDGGTGIFTALSFDRDTVIVE